MEGVFSGKDRELVRVKVSWVTVEMKVKKNKLPESK